MWEVTYSSEAMSQNMINQKLKKIVFIDDDAINNFLVQDQLDTCGYRGEAVFFEAAWEALRYLKNLKVQQVAPDLIFLDINMPIMNGFDFLDAFKELFRHKTMDAKIFMVSTSTNEWDIRRSEDSGLVAAYIEKPFSAKHLEKIVRQYFS